MSGWVQVHLFDILKMVCFHCSVALGLLRSEEHSASQVNITAETKCNNNITCTFCSVNTKHNGVWDWGVQAYNNMYMYRSGCCKGKDNIYKEGNVYTEVLH